MAPQVNRAVTEKTNINLYHYENRVYSPKVALIEEHRVTILKARIGGFG